ncbi:MAG: hypothetical protein WKF31_10185 [Thermoleophilaceae bacterium]
MFCDVRTPDGSPFPGDSRDALRRVMSRAEERGLSLQVGPEIEFYLFAEPTRGTEPVPLDDGAYFDLTPLDVRSTFRRRTMDYLELMSIPVKASHHEVGASQHELDLLHTDAMSMAEALVTFRLAIKEVARELGVHATFMPKPLDGQAGSGLHIHLSLFDARGSAFFSGGSEESLSPLGRRFLAGLVRHAPEICLVTNQWVNSYARLRTGYEAPRAAALVAPRGTARAGALEPAGAGVRGPGGAAPARPRLQPVPGPRAGPQRRTGRRGGRVRPAAGERGRRRGPDAGGPARRARRLRGVEARGGRPGRAPVSVDRPQQAGGVGRLPGRGERAGARPPPTRPVMADAWIYATEDVRAGEFLSALAELGFTPDARTEEARCGPRTATRRRRVRR